MTILEICAILAVVIFALLAGFIIRTLLPLQRSFADVEKKLKDLNPLVKTFSEDEDVKKIKDTKKIHEVNNPEDNVGFDVVEWILLSYKLGEKLIKRR